jgi:hypothetical protein
MSREKFLLRKISRFGHCFLEIAGRLLECRAARDCFDVTRGKRPPRQCAASRRIAAPAPRSAKPPRHQSK